jgi:hypothetical protein
MNADGGGGHQGHAQEDGEEGGQEETPHLGIREEEPFGEVEGFVQTEAPGMGAFRRLVPPGPRGFKGSRVLRAYLTPLAFKADS